MANKLGVAVEDLPLEVYTPAPALGEWAGLPSAMARDMASARELGWRLFVRDAPRSTGRACWALPGHCSLRSPPGSSSSCLQSKQVLALGDTAIPYPVYVLLGTTYWQIFVEALNAPLKSVPAAKPILARIAFPREALILSSAYLVVFNALVKSVVLVGVFLYFDVSLSVGLLFVPLAVGLLILLGLAVGLALTPIGLLYTDIASGLVVATQLWFFATPVIYPPPESFPLSLLATLPCEPRKHSRR
jgi:lipopolysaccharide transport system permease protein